MKKQHTVLLATVLVAFNGFAQTRNSFKYQAVVRDNQGAVIDNSTVLLNISILEDTENGTIVYSEEHEVTTNDFGLINLNIGDGTNPTGNFNTIGWATGSYFLKLEMAVGASTTLELLGVSPLLSVPYALHAETVTNNNDADADPINEIQELILTDATLSLTKANSVDLSSLVVPNTDEQNLSIKNDSLEISNGNKVNLAPYKDNTDSQTLTLTGSTLSIVGGNFVNLSTLQDADANPTNELQQLSVVNDSLVISKGNKVMLPKQDMLWANVGNNIFYNKGNVGIGTVTPQGKLEVKGATTTNPDDIIFGVLNSNGDTVFAVYQEGVRVYVGNSGKALGSRGGFAVGNLAAKGSEEYFRVTGDSVRININSNSKAVGNRGGFAIGNLAAKSTEQYFSVTRDSVRININESPKSAGSRGGFAVGNLAAKGGSSSYLQLTQNNYFIGQESGQNLTTGLYNSTLGYQSGLSLTSGTENAFMGYQGGYSNQSGSGNLFLGYQTGYSNVAGNYNSFLGYKAGYSNTEGLNNSFLGSFAGQSNSTGSYNIFVGDSSGFNNTTGANNSFLGTKAGFNNVDGYQNSFIGNYAGHSNTAGFANVFIGNSSGYSNIIAGGNVFIGNETGKASINGWNNVYIGTETGKNNLNGEGNVFLGFQTGINNAGTRNIFIGNRAGGNQVGSNKLIIDNWDGDSTQVFIWGDLQNDKLRINANIGIGMNPDWHNFSIYNKDGRATLNLKGKGDAYEYATLSLESEQTINNRTYVISHKADNRFGILYHDGTNWFSRINIDSLGHISMGTFDDGTEMLDVNGNARFRWVGSGTYTAALAITSNGTLTTATSDSTMKKNIISIDHSLQKVLGMNGVYFSWKNDTANNRKVGFIAQEMEKVLPEVVFTNSTDGLKGINYAELSSVLAGAIKEQQLQISNQQSEIELLKLELKEIKSLLNK